MADPTHDEEAERRRPGAPTGGAPALADDGDVAFGAMAGTAVLIALLVAVFLPQLGIIGGDTAGSHSEDKVVEVDDLEVDETASAEVGVVADVTASQGGITLNGTVPSQAVADDMEARALSLFAPDRVTNNLTIADDETSSFTINYTGQVTDPVLGARLQGLFAGVAGATIESTPEIVEPGAAEAALNALEPIEFASGSADIVGESAVILDEAAEILNGEPGLALEVSGHTDSTGDDAANLALSEARAAAVVQALQERGVTNDLTPRGYGETRLKEDPDETPEQQQANRRIEFRVL